MTAPATSASPAPAASPGVDTEEQAALRQSVASLLEKKSDSAAVRAAMNSDDGYDPALGATLVEQIGAAALSIPEESGGAGECRRAAVSMPWPTSGGQSIRCGPTGRGGGARDE